MGKSKYGNNGSRQWVHPQESLLRRYIIYNVKFLGKVEVERSKGMDIIKDAIRKMKFNKQIMKAEGQKLSKVDLTISIDGVSLQEPKTKVIKCRYPLHRISYCADDKTDKRMFTFIVKDIDDNKHYCFVFDSEKCAEDITLTIGQAFDLAYKRYNNGSGQNVLVKQRDILIKKLNDLDNENTKLKEKIEQLENIIGSEKLQKIESKKSTAEPIVGRKLELLDFNNIPQNGPSVPDKKDVLISLSPPIIPSRIRLSSSPENQGPSIQPRPVSSSSSDAFGMPTFNPTEAGDNNDLFSNTTELMDLQSGISFDDFTLEDLDPLNNKDV